MAFQLVAYPADEELHDLDHLVHGQLVEHDYLVNPVQELRPEVILQCLLDALLHPLISHRLARLLETERQLAQVRRPEVRGHDEHGVLEVDRTSLGVGEATVLEDLKEGVEDVRVRLLDLVEQHHRERLAPDGFGELTALLVAHVARRRPDEPAHGVLLHVLAHVELDQRGLVTEEQLGKRLGKLGLAHAGRAEEDERPARALGVLEAGTGAADRSRQGVDRVVLADNPLVQILLEAQETGCLLLGELVDRNPGPVR